MRHRIVLTRREFLRASTVVGGMVGLGRSNCDTGGVTWAQPSAPPKKDFAIPGVVHVIVFSNFEGWLQTPGPAVRWFEACSQAHPSIVWTHMYNPRYLVQLPEMVNADAEFTPYLLKVQSSRKAEVGLHIHMFYDLIRQLGVRPRTYPYAGVTTAECSHRRTMEADSSGGYDVLMTGYTLPARSEILDKSIDAFLRRGFSRPRSFCAGYSAADPALQALLACKGFTVSFSAQAISPNEYGSCWDHLLDWSGHITPLTIPYRVSRTSVLPPPHADNKYLDLVEVPLNMGVDASDLYMANQQVSRLDMFDRHYDWASHSGKETAVAIGVHADVVGLEMWGSGPVSRVIDGFLRHVARRATGDGAEIRYGTVSDVAQRFRHNRTIGHLESVF